MPLMNPDQLHAFLDEAYPQWKVMGIQVEHVNDSSIQIRMPAEDRHLRPGGTISGPAMMTLCDAAMYLMVLAQIGPEAHTATSSLSINFLHKPAAVDMLAEGKLLKLGKRLAVGAVTLCSEGDPAPVAHATVTYSIPPRGHSADE